MKEGIMLQHSPGGTPGHTPIGIRQPDVMRLEPEKASPLSEASMPRWLSVEQVRKMQRMRREGVIAAMRNGELPFEQRGRICYLRLTDVIAWEERRMRSKAQ